RSDVSFEWRLRSRQEKLTASHPPALWLLARLAAAAALLRYLAPARGALFFKWQPQLTQSQPHPSHTQAHLLGLFQLLAQFLQLHTRLLAVLPADPLLDGGRDSAHRPHAAIAEHLPLRYASGERKSFLPNPS